METARPRVVIVEDDHDVADLVIEVLNDEGFDAVTAGHAATAAEVTQMRPHLVILDLFLGSIGARDFLTALRCDHAARVPVVLMSASRELEREARTLGANAYLSKPFDIDDLVRTCRGLAAA